MTAKNVALLLGFVFIAVGALGFIDNPIIGESPDAIFHADRLHNLVHIGSGVLFVLIALAATSMVKGFMVLFGLVYLALGVIGYMNFGKEGMGKVLGILHVNAADNYLHIGLGLVILLAGMMTRRIA
jgi:hypothetical protein